MRSNEDQVSRSGVLSPEQQRQLYYYITHLRQMCEAVRVAVAERADEGRLRALQQRFDTLFVLVKVWMFLCQTPDT